MNSELARTLLILSQASLVYSFSVLVCVIARKIYYDTIS